MTGNMWRGDHESRAQTGDPLREGRTHQGASSSRPQIYVHFEFGMSFSPKHPPKPHAVTYRSKGIRDRDQRARQALSPHGGQNARLAQPIPQHSANMRPRALTHDATPQPPSYEFTTGTYSLPSQDPFGPSAEAYYSPASIERGGSAPPPMCDSPWDAEPEPVGFSALPRPRAPPASATANAPRPGGESEGGEVSRSESTRRRLNVPDSGLARDLASLSSAMMTVDNGFEDQWWYQGVREPAIEGAPSLKIPRPQHARSMPASPADVYDDPWTTGTGPPMLGWAIADEDLRPTRSSSLKTHHSTQLNEEWAHATRQFGAAAAGGSGPTPPARDVVSPLTEYYQPTPRQRVNSELWIYK